MIAKSTFEPLKRCLVSPLYTRLTHLRRRQFAGAGLGVVTALTSPRSDWGGPVKKKPRSKSAKSPLPPKPLSRPIEWSENSPPAKVNPAKVNPAIPATAKPTAINPYAKPAPLVKKANPYGAAAPAPAAPSSVKTGSMTEEQKRMIAERKAKARELFQKRLQEKLQREGGPPPR